MIFVTVEEPAGRAVYVNGVYEEVAGTVPRVFMLPPGSHKFETLDQGQRVDFRGRVRNVKNGLHKVISLAPVVPPEPIA